MAADSTDPLAQVFAEHRIAALVTLKRDGRPQISNIMYLYRPDERVFEISVTDSRAKTRNARRDPRVSLHVNANDGWGYAVAEGLAELSPVAQSPDDATVDALVEQYRALNGEHPNWDEFRAAMVADGRLLMKVVVERFYGLAR
ncbi:PPOX class F420-dependent oxidoreductase [Skermania sp. ID1734]|nr:PPOX class F420-dependent oxidoreductase [Skermania sp. ID1734]TSE01926.1 PPOX class F420-dependent oxidoreductase [Skermania sp. ID1734]